MIDRKTILEKLAEYLNNKISQEEIYKWALAVAVSEEYDELAGKDLLIRKTIQALIDIHHDDLKLIPTRKALEYYRRCLVGEEKFEPLEDKKDLKRLNIPDFPQEQPQRVKTPKPKKPKQGGGKEFYIAFRIYTIIFSISSLTIHIISIIKPDLFSFDEEIPTRMEVVTRSLPHLLYAFFVLVPMWLTARGVLYYLSFLVLTLGMLYYWYLSAVIVMNYSLHLIFILAILPFCAFPATLALYLLMVNRDRLRQKAIS